MLRFILVRHEVNNLHGINWRDHYTLDVDVPELQEALSRGGSGEMGFERHELVDVVVVADQEPKPDGLGDEAAESIDDAQLVKVRTKDGKKWVVVLRRGVNEYDARISETADWVCGIDLQQLKGMYYVTMKAERALMHQVIVGRGAQ